PAPRPAPLLRPDKERGTSCARREREKCFARQEHSADVLTGRQSRPLLPLHRRKELTVQSSSAWPVPSGNARSRPGGPQPSHRRKKSFPSSAPALPAGDILSSRQLLPAISL